MSDLFLALLAGGTGGSIVAFLAKTWIEARVAASIKHEYDQQFEQYKRGLDKRQKVELLAELFAEWIAVPAGEVIPKERRTRMNQLSFAAAIWLPADIVIEMSKTLQQKPNAKSYFEVLLLARKELTGGESLAPEDITYWDANLEKKGQPVIQRDPK
ncbi:MAG: hypothetical protein AABY99_03525 [Pseudomonadota bacterium]